MEMIKYESIKVEDEVVNFGHRDSMSMAPHLTPLSSTILPHTPESHSGDMERANSGLQQEKHSIPYLTQINSNSSEMDLKQSYPYLNRHSIQMPTITSVYSMHGSHLPKNHYPSIIPHSISQLNNNISSLALSPLPSSSPQMMSQPASTIKYCSSSPSVTVDTTQNKGISTISSSTSRNVNSMQSVNSTSNNCNSSGSNSSQKSPIDQPLNTPDTTKKTSNTRRTDKPPMSYINMIANAIRESPNGQLTLNEIYQYLTKT